MTLTNDNPAITLYASEAPSVAVIKHPAAKLEIRGDGGRVLLTIHGDGQVEGTAAEATEAGRIFADAVRHSLMP